MKKLLACISLLYSATSFATVPNIILDGTISNQITIHPERDKSKSIHTTKKDVVLMKVNLSNKAKAHFAEAATTYLHHPYIPSANGSKVHLAMNGTPALDQGHHGSCVTFATTAALDAVLGLGHYISQLCNLELGSYIAAQEDMYSGWDGSWAELVIGQIKKYGFINVPSQVVKGCSGYHIYPEKDENDRGQPMPISDFIPRSEMLPATISFDRVLGVTDYTTSQIGEAALERTKESIRAGNRVLIGTITDSNMGNAGALGKYKYDNDSYILTPELAKDAQQGLLNSAHEMVVTGFDDNATMTAKDGTVHYGVIKLRNSWGYLAGDWGDTYMSYDYFKTFVFDAVAVVKN